MFVSVPVTLIILKVRDQCGGGMGGGGGAEYVNVFLFSNLSALSIFPIW